MLRTWIYDIGPSAPQLFKSEARCEKIANKPSGNCKYLWSKQLALANVYREVFFLIVIRGWVGVLTTISMAAQKKHLYP